jgi:hypothetical protein
MISTERVRHHHRTAAAIAVVGSLAAIVAAAAPPAAATEPQVVSLAACGFGSGSIDVAAGVPISLRLPGFAEGTRGLIVDFLLKERTVLTVTAGDATRRTDLTTSWASPQQVDTHLWLTRPPNVDLGSLAPGASLAVTEEITFRHPLLVAFPPVGPSGDNGPFLTAAEDPVSCLITAE